MRLKLHRWFAAAVLPLMLAQPAASQTPVPEGPAYIVSYFETAPAMASQARSLLGALARSGRNEAGNLQMIALQRIGASNHFAVLEAWKDKEAQAAHAGAASTKEFRSKLEPQLRSPYDERPHFTFAALMPDANAVPSAIYAVTHVDIIPTSKDAGLELVKALVLDSRKDAGMLAFNALQQSSRPNHVTLVEVWSDSAAVDAHGTSTHMKDFRTRFMPLSGSLYDERLYTVVE